MRKDIKVVAFDVDGTLYSNFEFYLKVAGYFLKHLKFFYHFVSIRNLLHIIRPVPDFYGYQADLVANDMDIEYKQSEEMIQKIAYEGMAPYFQKVKLYPYVEETFAALKNAGYRIAILSDFPPEQKGDLWGLKKYCDVIMSTEACGALKPSKCPFEALVQKLNVKSEEILYIGNHIAYDVEGAKNAGLKAGFLMTGLRKLFGIKARTADVSFKDYRQLKKYMLE
jgi:putative hydrolase of the HAD superfamily